MSVLTKQIGPWPAYVWGGIAVTGVGVGLLLRRSSLFGGGGEEVPPVEEEPEGGEYLAGPQLQPGGVVAQPVVTPPTTAGGPTRNLEWGILVTNWLISQNVPASIAQSAVQKFLEGQPLTAQEAGALNLGLNRWGAPPEGAPPAQVPSTPPTSPPPPPSPTTITYFTRLSPHPVQARGARGGAWLGWKAVTGATGYEVRIVHPSGQRSAWRHIGGASTTTFQKALVRRTQFMGFEVRATKGSTKSPTARSNTVPVTP